MVVQRLPGTRVVQVPRELQEAILPVPRRSVALRLSLGVQGVGHAQVEGFVVDPAALLLDILAWDRLVPHTFPGIVH